jgi:hypothetical protein
MPANDDSSIFTAIKACNDHINHSKTASKVCINTRQFIQEGIIYCKILSVIRNIMNSTHRHRIFDEVKRDTVSVHNKTQLITTIINN